MKITILSYFLMISFTISAQQKLGIQLDFNRTSFTHDLEDMSEMAGLFSPGLGFVISIQSETDLSERLSVSVGVGYACKSYEVKGSEFMWPSQIDPTSGYLEWKSPVDNVILGDHLGVHTFQYITLPVLVKYTVGSISDHKVRLIGGLTGLYMSSSNATFSSPNDAGGTRERMVNLNFNTNNSNVMASFGAEFEVWQSGGLSLTVVPSFSMDIFSSAKIISGYRLTTGSLGVLTKF